MATIRQSIEFPIRSANKDKEPEWSSLCNDVFQQYLDDADPFNFTDDRLERSSSDDWSNVFDSSASSNASKGTDFSSIPSAHQTADYEADDFWTKTLRALEQNAHAESERSVTAAASNPDFLSLGGWPSPPAAPSSPTLPPIDGYRRRSRARVAANGSKTPTGARSVSRGRPTGISKSGTSTVRKCSASPPKMMNPSRYRAGFQDAWAERISEGAKSYQLRVPSLAGPISPPPSARLVQYEDFGCPAFGSPPQYPQAYSLSAFDDQLSPLTNTFQQARLYTPVASPLISPNSRPRESYFEPAPPLPPNPYQTTQTVPLNDVAPTWPDRTSSLAVNTIDTFDFGFSSSPDYSILPATAYEPAMPSFNTTVTSSHDIFGTIDSHSMTSSGPSDLASSGLMISCDPSLVSNYTSGPDIHPMTQSYNVAEPEHPSYSTPPHPSTPHHRRTSSPLFVSPSASPPPPPDSRSRSRSRRRASSSRHRRNKSSTQSTPRHSVNLDRSGFVNFTPQDSGKILNGVAPSGSSKTKARREMEAADRRRKLSQAAVRAVVEAGGDVDLLRRDGLFV